MYMHNEKRRLEICAENKMTLCYGRGLEKEGKLSE